MALAVVQSVGTFGNNVSSITTGAITTTAGNLLHVDSGCYSGTANTMAVSDSKSNTYVPAVAKYLASLAQVYCQSDYVKNCTGGASHTFTLALGGNGYPAIGVVEVSGADTTSPLDLHESFASSSQTTSPSFTTSGTTAQADEIAIAGIIDDDTNGTRISAEASGFTGQYDSFPGDLTRLHNATKILSATGTVTYNPTFNLSSHYAIQISTYKAAGAGGGVSGSAAWTETKDTWAGAGAVAIAGTAAWTETKDGWAATGGIVGTGTAAWTETKDTWSATGTVTTGPSGSVAWTEAADSWAASGGVVISGTVSWTETKDTWAISGSITLPGVTGSASWTEQSDIWLGAGNNGVLWTPVTPASGTWTPATLSSTVWTPSS